MRASKRPVAEQREKVQKLLAEGQSKEAIAEATGMSEWQVTKRFRELGMAPEFLRVQPELVEKAKTLLLAGASLRNTSIETGVSTKTVRKIADSIGIAKRRSLKKKEFFSEKDVANFWAQTRAEGECLLWTGKTMTIGKLSYGCFWAASEVSRSFGHAHRVSVALTLGQPLPEGVIIWHTCKNTLCVKPEHLEIRNRMQPREEKDNGHEESDDGTPEGDELGSQGLNEGHSPEDFGDVRGTGGDVAVSASSSPCSSNS